MKFNLKIFLKNGFFFNLSALSLLFINGCIYFYISDTQYINVEYIKYSFKYLLIVINVIYIVLFYHYYYSLKRT